MWRALLISLYFEYGAAILWPKGVVHFAINAKDYDVHSQDVILSTLEELEREICVKFFNIPADFNATERRVLYVNNPNKQKDCPPQAFNFTQPVIDMPIGYKCIDKKSITRVVVDMLRASVEDTEPTLNSFDLIRKFQEMQEDPTRSYLITPTDRNFINANYHSECRSSARAPPAARRSSGDVSLSEANQGYYNDKAWPLGIVMFGVEEEIAKSAPYIRLKHAMTSIEMSSCVVFQEMTPADGLKPNNFLWFGKVGAEAPKLGFKEGNQSISLLDMVSGAPGHTAHTINLLMRALGIPMTSNRPDRDNHLNIHWNNVEQGKEHYLEQYPTEAWVRDARLPYDFESVTHAPANYMCRSCLRGETTVEPAHDNLWSRALSMGHHTELSDGDRLLLEVIYSELCRNRYETSQ